MRKKKQTKWQYFNFKLFMIKIRILLWTHDLRKRISRGIHCEKGFHKYKECMTKLTVGSTMGTSRSWESNYFKCDLCGKIVMLTEKDKRNYIFIKNRENNNFKKLFEAMLKDGKNKKKVRRVKRLTIQSKKNK